MKARAPNQMRKGKADKFFVKESFLMIFFWMQDDLYCTEDIGHI